MQAPNFEFDLENVNEYKLIRLDNMLNQRSCYLEVHSQNFPFYAYDSGNKIQKQTYQITPQLDKYYSKRKFLFSKFQDGIHLDAESWYSVIPQKVSLYLRNRFLEDGFTEIFEPFSGVGGIAIHLCDAFDSYVINDIDTTKIAMLKHNMRVYGKNPNKTQIYIYDFLEIRPFETQMLIICPPWGGINTQAYSYEDLDKIMDPTLTDILTHALKFSKNILLQMPKNTNIYNLAIVIQKCGCYPVFSIQKIQTTDKTSQLFVYIGEEKFTHVRNSTLFSRIYSDLQLYQKKDRVITKKRLKEEPDKLMQSIFKVKTSKNKHVFFKP